MKLSLNEFKQNFESNFIYYDKEFSCKIIFMKAVSKDAKYLGAIISTASSLIAVVKTILPNKILEIGSWKYYTANAIACFIEDTYENTDEVVIDTFDIKKGGYNGGTATLKSKLIKQHYWMPHKTGYDAWKFNDNDIIHKEFKELSNKEIFEKNLTYLNSIKPKSGYDLIFIDGDHSFDGVKFDFEYSKNVLNKDGIIIFDDREGHKNIDDFFKTLPKSNTWDFTDLNDRHFKTLNIIHNFGIYY